ASEIARGLTHPLILNSSAEDSTSSHQEALLKIYQRLRPGDPPQLEKAIELFHEKFFDVNRYRCGRVERFGINRKSQQDVPAAVRTLRSEHFINAIRYILKLRLSDPS